MSYPKRVQVLIVRGDFQAQPRQAKFVAKVNLN